MKNFVQKGKNLTFAASQIVHPTHSPNYPNSGDVCVIGRIAGIANQDAAAATDNVVVSTEGVYNVPVVASNNGVTLGAPLYANKTTAVVSEDDSSSTQIPFGVALDTVSAGQTKTIPVRLFGATPGALGYDFS